MLTRGRQAAPRAARDDVGWRVIAGTTPLAGQVRATMLRAHLLALRGRGLPAGNVARARELIRYGVEDGDGPAVFDALTDWGASDDEALAVVDALRIGRAGRADEANHGSATPAHYERFRAACLRGLGSVRT